MADEKGRPKISKNEDRPEDPPPRGPRPPRPFRISAGYLAAVALIFGVTSAAWLFLGRVTDRRTVQRDALLRGQVGQIWGGEHRQVAPRLTAPKRRVPAKVAPAKAAATTTGVERAGKDQDPHCTAALALKPKSTLAKVTIDLEHRRKGLLWYNTYAVSFDALYTFANPAPCARPAWLAVPMPAKQAVYDDFTVEIDGKPVEVSFVQRPQRAAIAALRLRPSARAKVRVRYRSRGLDRWAYMFGRTTSRAPDFTLQVRTNFDKVDFPAGTLSPTSKKSRDGPGWLLTWHFSNLLSDSSIAVTMPRKINPGPLASEISRFAPVSLLFFFGVLLLVAVIRQVRLHPIHFAMLAGAFFAYHLLFAYLVDHVSLTVALSISSVTSVALVVSYLRVAIGPRFALLWAGGAQLLYLVLFSLAFCWEGYTGLTITIFSILTLFVAMQLTARIDWFAKFDANLPSTAAPATAMDVQDAFQRVH